jgi:hypothetical protein
VAGDEAWSARFPILTPEARRAAPLANFLSTLYGFLIRDGANVEV